MASDQPVWRRVGTISEEPVVTSDHGHVAQPLACRLGHVAAEPPFIDRLLGGDDPRPVGVVRGGRVEEIAGSAGLGVQPAEPGLARRPIGDPPNVVVQLGTTVGAVDDRGS